MTGKTKIAIFVLDSKLYDENTSPVSWLTEEGFFLFIGNQEGLLLTSRYQQEEQTRLLDHINSFNKP